MLRPLQEADIERLSQLWLHLACGSHPSLPVRFWTLQGRAFRRQLVTQCRNQRLLGESTGSNHWVYTRAGSNIAEGMVTITDNVLIQTIFVSPAVQRCGVGSELMAQAKFGRLQLETRVLEENLHGRYFLQQHGFTETERRFSTDAGQHEIWMNCKISIPAVA
ncbi:GNAT family N-acetyltransferase [Microbulbifer bruguierae]|uniref:GNAT family N-acetyltransferase n=1 Tax=Microbulbifer bruguierae TaxID=3029061 RepID=A0ABY8N978_9GAMM|nr:GNAT family N-acetyltransferase [Microbulbifer bruguierae]WGL15358.1 GNAT family N-acetyltransferase [Microbulbifer bruguierae]